MLLILLKIKEGPFCGSYGAEHNHNPTITQQEARFLNIAYLKPSDSSFFTEARNQLDVIISQLEADPFSNKEHGEVEQHINTEGFEVLRLLFQGYLNQTADNELSLSLITSEGDIPLNHVKNQTSRKLVSQFGPVTVTRKGYSQRQQASQFPLDAQLNLPEDQYSDGIRQRVAVEAIKGSFDSAIESIDQTTGGHVPKRQSLQLAQDVAQDFEAYYQQKRFIEPEKTDDLLILTLDGKGIVMRKEGLRECTKKAAEKNKKLNSRLSPGEKKDRKRMAMVAAVYTVLPDMRTAQSIMNPTDEKDNVRRLRAPARNKRVWASVERESESVIEEAFLEALQRDPNQQRHWVILIDGLPHQIALINKVKKRMKLNATIVMDFIHVLEYLWKAAWCFFEKGDNAVEDWIGERAIKILNGQCGQVAKGIRLSATKKGIINRENVDKCADYLLNNKCRLQYGEALKAGFPIASGVIEGACRHLINDRLDITGARWSLHGSEAVLKLRSLKSSGDFESYWEFHKQQSKQRLHSNFQISGHC